MELLCAKYNIKLCYDCKHNYDIIDGSKFFCWLSYYNELIQNSSIEVLIWYMNALEHDSSIYYFIAAVNLFASKYKDRIDKLLVLL